jgi:hypothetical protein
LPGSLKDDDLVPGITKGEGEGKKLLDVGVETSEHHKSPFGMLRCEAIGWQQAVFVGNGDHIALLDAVVLPNQVEEAFACRELRRLVRFLLFDE